MTLVVVGSTYGLPTDLAFCSNRDREVRFDRLALRKLVLDLKSSSALASFGVPLLSQEGPTCRLLPGAAAPWSPALDPVSKFPADARFVFVVVEGKAVTVGHRLRTSLVR